MSTKVDCKNCQHFRSAPYEARKAGCYYPPNMKSKQSDAYLDEQQLPGKHERINRKGDCPDFRARPAKAPLWQRLWSIGA